VKKVFVAAAVAASAVFMLAATASAAPKPAPWGGTTPVQGTPAHICAYLTGNDAVHHYITDAYAGYGIDTYSGCVRTFAKGTPIVLDEVNDPEGFGGDAVQQCAFLETMGVTYPFVFTEGPGAPFPLFRGSNRAECSRILFALHATGIVLGEG
jgi:hypothetical protein